MNFLWKQYVKYAILRQKKLKKIREQLYGCQSKISKNNP